MAALVRIFELEHREYRGRHYWETIPPGLLVLQIQSGGTVTCGNMTWTVKADCYFAGLKAVEDLIDQGLLLSPYAGHRGRGSNLAVGSGISGAGWQSY